MESGDGSGDSYAKRPKGYRLTREREPSGVVQRL